MVDDTSDSTATYGAVTPEEAFSLVGNEVRTRILLALSETTSASRELPVLSFSELYSRVDADVNSSQFNYHLQRLVGHFVESRDEDDPHFVDQFGGGDESGYALSPAGLLLAWTVRASTASGEPTLEPFDAGFDCYHCDAPVEAVLWRSVFKTQCPDCDYLYDYNLAPPGLLAGVDDDEAVRSRISEYNRNSRVGMARGVCPRCASDVDQRFVAPAETNDPRSDRRAAFVNASCPHCGNIDYLTVGELLLQDPALVSFCHDHGLDVTGARLWDLAFVMTDRCVTVRDTDPWAVAFRLTLGDDALEIVLDDDVEVVERTRP